MVRPTRVASVKKAAAASTPGSKPAKRSTTKVAAKKSAAKASAEGQEYIVEKVVGVGYDEEKKERWFEIKWKGYPASENTKEPESTLSSIQSMIRQFLAQHNEWDVEEILEWKRDPKAKTNFFKVKWLGWPEQYNTWEPEENLDCESKLKAFQATLSPVQ